MAINMLPELSVKTVLADYNDVEARVPGTYTLFPQTTLNTLYNTYPNITDITSPPTIGYFGLGIGGFFNIGDKTEASPYQPKKDDLGLYKPIPIRCVPIDEDLDTTTRSQYRMRVRQTFNGQQYWCYYLKKIEILDNTARIVRIDPITKKEIEYEMTQDQLTPKPTIPTTSGAQEGAITEVVVTKRVKCAWVGSEVYEGISAIYNGDLRYAKISEYGIFSGDDRIVEGYASDGTSFRYTESIYTQLQYHICNLGSVVPSADYNGTRIISLGSGSLLLKA